MGHEQPSRSILAKPTGVIPGLVPGTHRATRPKRWVLTHLGHRWRLVGGIFRESAFVAWVSVQAGMRAITSYSSPDQKCGERA